MGLIAAYLPYVQIVLAVILIAAILLQQGDTEGAGGAFGANDNFARGYHTRRGFERILFNSSIVIVVLFAASALLTLIYR